MFRDYASNRAVVGLTLLAAAATTAVLYWVVRLWPEATVTSPSEQKILTMIVLMGALGGLLLLRVGVLSPGSTAQLNVLGLRVRRSHRAVRQERDRHAGRRLQHHLQEGPEQERAAWRGRP
jgi:hypothetical protein